jgi:hypothetical protein
MGVLKNETGNRYGRLTVLEKQRPDPSANDTRARWVCRCDCGNETVASGLHLRRGSVRSCGCLHLKDETGKRYGMLTVLERQRPAPAARNSRWICICDCGTETVRAGWVLRGGRTISCGCRRGKNPAPWLEEVSIPFRYVGAPRRGTATLSSPST